MGLGLPIGARGLRPVGGLLPVGSLCGFVPFLFAVMEHFGAVFRQEPALCNECVNGLLIAGEIVVAACVACGDGSARVAGLMAVGFGLWERQIGTFKGDALIGGADGGIAEIPSSVSGERDGDLGQTHAIALVAVGIDLRNKDGEGCSDFGRLKR